MMADAGFQAVDDSTESDQLGPIAVDNILSRGHGLEFGFVVVARRELEIMMSFMSEASANSVQVVSGSVLACHFRGKDAETRTRELLKTILMLHRELNARRTIAEYGLDDGLTPYSWQQEWHRLENGLVEGVYWLDLLCSELVSDEYQERIRSIPSPPLMFKTFSWGTFFRARLLPT
ncbi:MAG: hypothetical protein MJE77_14855 [Proteobacteria bacterium]|nr:hypothetical protein [Pseudomonadota bacterium]